MCWISENKPVLQIAKKDIPVFKVALFEHTFNRIISLIQKFEYEIGKLYNLQEELKIQEFITLWTNTTQYRIYKGFHSYSYENKIIESLSNYQICYIGFINDWLNKLVPSIRLECIIPEGSKYYLNECGEYVSDQIKIIDYKYLKECVG